MKIESKIRHFARLFGVDIKRYRPADNDTGRLCKMLISNGVNIVLDVGANTGQFGASLRESGYRGQIVSFEPLTHARESLMKLTANDANWHIAPAAAIGNKEGEIDIHVSANSVSSSILDMLDTHTTSAPDSKYIGSERVPLRRLDIAAASYLDTDSVPFLKIDTQGYEDRVLDGAKDLINRIVGVQIELSLIPLYEGQLLHQEVIDRLTSWGYELWGLHPGFTSPDSGRLLQFDGIFFRE